MENIPLYLGHVHCPSCDLQLDKTEVNELKDRQIQPM